MTTELTPKPIKDNSYTPFIFANKSEEEAISLEVARLQSGFDNDLPFLEQVFERLELTHAATFLDLGCGPGIISMYLAEKYPHLQIIGVDRLDGFLAWGQREAKLRGLQNVTFIKAQAEELPIESGSVDRVLARYIFQHLPEPERVVGEISRTLASGGRVALFDWDDGLVVMHPDNPLHDKFEKAIAERRRKMGADTCVGRKFYSFLYRGGFQDIGVQVFYNTSCDTDRMEMVRGQGFDTDPPVEARVVKEGYLTAAELSEFWVSMRQALLNPENFFLYGVFSAWGRKA
jgi:ubiquinone/menaquinone biosynthesis C-methylase UbiE